DGMLADLKQWYAQVGLPVTLRELGAAGEPSDAELSLAAELSLKARHAANFDRTLDVATLAAALRRHA
ncbi:MAG TPA: alcohol dehydrogenase, partial [Achromobacter sp.]|nr:alcohol dehydrogenase [Achromobacter sp.]